MHGLPNRNIVTEELQHMIVTSNQGRFEPLVFTNHFSTGMSFFQIGLFTNQCVFTKLQINQECSLHEEPEGQCAVGAG